MMELPSPDSPGKRLVRIRAIFLIAAVLILGVATSAYADHSKGGRESSDSTDLYAASASLTAKTDFHPHDGTCVLQALTVTEVSGNHQAEVGLARCSGVGRIDGTCDGGHKYIEIQSSLNSYSCYQKGSFVNDHSYPASDSSSAVSNYTDFTGRIDGETVNHYSGFIFESSRDTEAFGEVNGNGTCPNSDLTMHFSNWTKWTLGGSEGGVYVKGTPFEQHDPPAEPDCFSAGINISDTGDFNVSLR